MAIDESAQNNLLMQITSRSYYQSNAGRYFFFPGLFFIIFSYFGSFMVVWGLGFWGWGLILGIWGWGFQLMGFGACGVGPSGFFGLGLSI